MKKSTKLTLFVTIALVLIVAVFAVLNIGRMKQKAALQSDASFTVVANGETHTVTQADLQNIGLQDVVANYKPSDNPAPMDVTFTGVPLKSVLDSLKIDYAAATTITFTALDGYHSAADVNKALDTENCWIVVAREGEPLGTKSDGGTGPVMMIFATDQFSQNWCKFLMEVAIA